MRAVMVRFSSLEADHSLRPPVPLQRGPAGGALVSYNRGQGDRKVDACDAACSLDHKISGHRSQSLSSYTFV